MTARLNNILLGVAIACLSLIMIWGLLGWYITKDARQQLIVFLQENVQNKTLNSIDAELLSYKTTLIGAKASIKISSKIAFIDEQIGELLLNAQLYYGPVFIDDGTLRFGKVLWKVSLDPLRAAHSISESSQAIRNEIFQSNKPFLSLFIDFDNTQRYHSHIRALTTASLRADHLISDGVVSADSLQNKMHIQAENLSLIASTNVLNIPTLEINLTLSQQKQRQQKLIRYTTKPFKLSFSETLGTTSQRLFTSNGSLVHRKQLLSGKLQLKTQRAEELALRVDLRDLSVRGYQQFLEAEAQVFNLKQQIQWTLEENAETPEGQDHIWQLNDRIEQQRGQLTYIVAKKMLPKKTSLIHLSFDRSKKIELPTFMRQALTSYSERGVLNQIDDHYQMVITSEGNQLFVNNRSMTWRRFLQVFLAERN